MKTLRRLPTLSLSLALLAASTGITSAALATRTYSSGAQSVAINGVTCSEVTGWSGGDIAGTVTTSSLGGTTKKHISSISYDPIVVETTLPLSPALTDALSSFLSGKNTPQPLTLTTADANGKTESTLLAANAVIEEVQFPKLDGSSKDPFRLTFIFRAESVKSVAADGSATRAGAKVGAGAIASNFRITLDGLPSTRIASLEAFSITNTTTGKPAGVFNAASAAIATPNISDLTVAISAADRAAWTAWRDTFLVQGNSQDTAEKSATLELLGPDMKSTIFTLKLANLGLIRLSTPPTEGEAIARLQAELYVETASLPSATAPAAPPKAVLDAPASLNIAPVKRPVVKP
ncbi:hypothetical protein CMV30_15335 [Nibricoccus aquaticus]|uniref:PEP-CTERM sorting domain-containing protein n=1 Tax=Nibricoccus aquaticus TaxID=2576891 RepID=A0A290QAD1_9BACT|nr:hypothetical protein [Nibricoccus aquaticus]ATC65217.1 hypothetical protein CMV30_15335 [Nibricoccus aquaticus]